MKLAPLAQHLSVSFELAKKLFPLYLKLLVKFLPYPIAYTVLIFLSLKVSFFFGFLSLIAIIVMAVMSVRYNVSLIKGVAAVASGKEGDADKLWMESKGYFWKMFFLSIVLALVLGIGFMLFVIPGLVLSVFLIFSLYILVLSDKNIFEALGASMRLAKGSFWPVLLRIIVVAVVGIILNLPAQLFGSSMDFDAIKANPAAFSDMSVIYSSLLTPGFFLGMVYSFVAGFLLICFGHAYLYLTYRELEKSQK